MTDELNGELPCQPAAIELVPHEEKTPP